MALRELPAFGGPATQDETHILTLRDNGREIVAAVGDTLVVSLPETPSTCFRWVVEAQGGLRPAGDSRRDPLGQVVALPMARAALSFSSV